MHGGWPSDDSSKVPISSKWVERFRSYGVEICQYPLTWPLAYTTAYTTVQAVMIWPTGMQYRKTQNVKRLVSRITVLAWPVGLSLCLSVCHTSEPCPVDPIDIPFGLRTRVGGAVGYYFSYHFSRNVKPNSITIASSKLV